MPAAEETFVQIVENILRRFCEQNDHEPPDASILRGLAERLHVLTQTHGLPRPLARDEQGTPGELPEAECALLLERVLANASAEDRERLTIPLRQLVKACFHPEFKICRDSFREVSDDGSCRRQQLVRVRGRVSGAHCIDCPYWTALSPGQHARFLDRSWQPAGHAVLAANAAIFLPQDFRELRRWLYAMARRI